MADDTKNASIAVRICLFYIKPAVLGYVRFGCVSSNGNDNICVVKSPCKNKKIGAVWEEMPTKCIGFVKIKDKMHLNIKFLANNLCINLNQK